MGVGCRSFSYAPGELAGVARWPLCVLIELEPQDPVITKLVSVMDIDPSCEAVLDYLSREGVTRIPSFGVMSIGENNVRVILHGQISALVDGAETPGTQLFVELVASLDSDVVLVSHVGTQSPERLPLRSGVVRAGLIQWLGSTRATPQTMPESQTQVIQENPRGFDHLFGNKPSLAPVTDGLTNVPQDPGRTLNPIMTTSLSGLVDDLPEPVVKTEPPAFIDSFEWKSPPSTTKPSQPVQREPVQREPVPKLKPSFDATIRKSDLSSFNGSGQTMVVAFLCAQGHYSPPYESHCRVCSCPMNPNQPVVKVPRPTLGVLRLWGGSTVILDRGVIFGRDPHLITGHVGSDPNLIKIDDKGRDVSLQHCEVRLEDWFVTIRDLNSTNGTQVIQPHRPPETLRPHEPTTLESGARVILANAFDFVFEVSP